MNQNETAQCEKTESCDLSRDLAKVINSHNREALTNTPDFILGGFLDACLEALENAIVARENWYGIHLSIGSLQRQTPSGKVIVIPKTDLDKLIEAWSSVGNRRPGLEPAKDPEPRGITPPKLAPSNLPQLRSELQVLKVEHVHQSDRIRHLESMLAQFSKP